MLTLSQRDPLWRNTKIGKTDRTVGQVGCTTTCVSMSSDYFGCYKNPGAAAQKLSYTPGALLIWSSVGRIFPHMKFHWREYKYNKAMFDDALKNPLKTCLLNVDNGAHWVLGIRSLGFGKYWVADPWDGRRKIYSGVVGGAILIRK